MVARNSKKFLIKHTMNSETCMQLNFELFFPWKWFYPIALPAFLLVLETTLTCTRNMSNSNLRGFFWKLASRVLRTHILLSDKYRLSKQDAIYMRKGRSSLKTMSLNSFWQMILVIFTYTYVAFFSTLYIKKVVLG